MHNNEGHVLLCEIVISIKHQASKLTNSIWRAETNRQCLITRSQNSDYWSQKYTVASPHALTTFLVSRWGWFMFSFVPSRQAALRAEKIVKRLSKIAQSKSCLVLLCCWKSLKKDRHVSWLFACGCFPWAFDDTLLRKHYCLKMGLKLFWSQIRFW